MPIIQVENLRKCFWTGQVAFPALNGVDLTVEEGEFLVLAGRSGSGKTTLLNMIGGLEVPDQGSIHVKGDDLGSRTRDQRALFRLRHIGFVFQAYNLIRVLNARENVAFVCQLQGHDRRACLEGADRWLARVGLGELQKRRPDQLSGGQQQRVAVARALASKPDIVLADEPTANLDSATGRELIALMKELNSEYGTTFVISSHDPAVIAAAGRLVRLHDGRVTGSPGNLREATASEVPCPAGTLTLTGRLLLAIKELREKNKNPKNRAP